MAEGLARGIFGPSVHVDSAGMEACVGESASAYAQKFFKDTNVDLWRHGSSELRAELMAAGV